MSKTPAGLPLTSLPYCCTCLLHVDFQSSIPLGSPPSNVVSSDSGADDDDIDDEDDEGWPEDIDAKVASYLPPGSSSFSPGATSLSPSLPPPSTAKAVVSPSFADAASSVIGRALLQGATMTAGDCADCGVVKVTRKGGDDCVVCDELGGRKEGEDDVPRIHDKGAATNTAAAAAPTTTTAAPNGDDMSQAMLEVKALRARREREANDGPGKLAAYMLRGYVMLGKQCTTPPGCNSLFVRSPDGEEFCAECGPVVEEKVKVKGKEEEEEEEEDDDDDDDDEDEMEYYKGLPGINLGALAVADGGGGFEGDDEPVRPFFSAAEDEIGRRLLDGWTMEAETVVGGGVVMTKGGQRWCSSEQREKEKEVEKEATTTPTAAAAATTITTSTSSEPSETPAPSSSFTSPPASAPLPPSAGASGSRLSALSAIDARLSEAASRLLTVDVDSVGRVAEAIERLARAARAVKDM